jgi:putative oxidoreductase
MMKTLSSLAPQILALTRILVGLSFATHGAQKILGAFGGPLHPMPPALLWSSGGIELLTGVLLALGLFTRPAAFLASGTMAVGYFMAHAPQGFWPIQNGGELAIAYCWLFLYLAAQGPGAWALDQVRRTASVGAPGGPELA